MTDYKCITQHDSITSFTGPSGTMYLSEKGRCFRVESEVDKVYFDNNHRFEKQGAIKKLVEAIIPQKTVVDEDLEFFLEKVRVNKKIRESVKRLYKTKKELVDEYIAGGIFDKLEKAHAKKLISAIKQEIEEEE
jgi:hypothetical protein